jgi:uncharacterized protein YkwD
MFTFFRNSLGALFILFNLFACTTQITQQEKYPFSKWDETTKQKANTAKNATYLSEQEKETIYLMNLARLNGKLFAETYVQEYIDNPENKIKKNQYTSSLISDLKNHKGAEPLLPQQDLFNCAKNHAEETGKKGTMGHENYSKRFKQFAPRYKYTGENCDYGNSKALDIVMSLLIDDNVPDKGHRKNILKKEYLSVGVSIQPHKKWDYTAVICFGDLK